MASFKIDEKIFDKLSEILKKHNLSEIEYKDGDVSIRISAYNAQHNVQNAAPQVIQQLPPATAQEESIQNEKIDYKLHPGALKSPIVGTCYLSPEPGSANFVSLGDDVLEGQPVLIIEAMKVMNYIKAHKSGKIVHIAVETGSPIEYAQLLLVID
ncbi:acetyl-CoA carboxylase, biotin carboxyl carrier protein [Alphaproteobacteria bacterium]|nr:acetyl-CoA carboxylase, biotin carboxyl carrier protein [Alphaproteobacteria bacterium]